MILRQTSIALSTCAFLRQLSTTWNLQKSRTAFKQSLRLITDQC